MHDLTVHMRVVSGTMEIVADNIGLKVVSSLNNVSILMVIFIGAVVTGSLHLGRL